MEFRQEDIFVAGEGGYHTYRIPALVVSTRGTILAFCEGRKNGPGDAGDIDLLLRRSFDNGQTWQETQLIVDDGPDTAGNPAPVVDASTGVIWLVFCKNLGDGDETRICRGEAPRTVWVTKSSDDGATWATPEEITDSVKDPSWTWYATGPCHGIQLKSGRLVIPCDHRIGINLDPRTDPYHSHVIHSDDHGTSWKAGGIVPPDTNESAIIQTADGPLYINCRNWGSETRRAYAWSYDDGATFRDFGRDGVLVEPRCQASMVRFTDRERDGSNRVLFSNPASVAREKLTVRLSYDECRSWDNGRVLHRGPAAYSDLCVADDMSICCLYERGDERPYEKLTFARFTIGWLTDGRDGL